MKSDTYRPLKWQEHDSSLIDLTFHLFMPTGHSSSSDHSVSILDFERSVIMHIPNFTPKKALKLIFCFRAKTINTEMLATYSKYCNFE